MSRFLNLSAPAVLLASAFGADNPLKEAETPAGPGSGPELCQVAVLRNGFTIEYLRREVAGPATRLWLCGGAGAGYAEIASQQIERFEESRGTVPPAPAVPASVPETAATGDSPLDRPFRNLIASAALRYQIDPDFVASVVKAESGFNSTAVSPKGAQGLMQLMPETAAKLGADDVFDPATNLGAGTKYLRQLLDQFAGDAVKALAAYNAGPQRVEQYGGVPPYRETRAYVTRIIEDYNRKKLQQQANSPAAPANK
jgi:soluble lytic murein transglycosylase-like protein